MGLPELFVAALIAGLSAINAAMPLAAWGRLRDPRFLLLGGASLGLMAVGLVWTWGQLPGNPPGYAAAELPVLFLVLLVVVLLLGSTLLPRRR